MHDPNRGVDESALPFEAFQSVPPRSHRDFFPNSPNGFALVFCPRRMLMERKNETESLVNYPGKHKMAPGGGDWALGGWLEAW